jgi:hypothetical protein
MTEIGRRVSSTCEPGSSVSIVQAGQQGDCGSIFGRREMIFPLTSVSRPVLGPILPPVQWVPGVLFPGLRRDRERRYSSYSFSTSALDGVSGQRYAPAALCPGERIPGTHCTGGWVDFRAGPDTEVRGKILCPCRG